MMKMNKKTIAVILAAILIVGVLFVILPRLAQPNNLSIQFYDANGDKVGSALSVPPLAPVLVGDVEVESFTITVNWYTNDPIITHVGWTINVKVYYYEPDVVPLQEHVVFDDLCWMDNSPNVPTEPGAKTSAHYYVEAYALEGVPTDTTFFLEFYGFCRFYKTTPPGGPIADADFVPLPVQCFHSHYAYTATIIINW